MDRSYTPEVSWPEKNKQTELDRSICEEAGCTAYRQWGGADLFAVILPPSPNGVLMHIVTKKYADWPDRAAARAAGYREAVRQLKGRGVV